MTITAHTGCRGLNLHKQFFSRKLVKIAHNHGLLISVWTVSERDGFEKFIQGGADNVTTKDVSALVFRRKAHSPSNPLLLPVAAMTDHGIAGLPTILK